jgi:hypothetical protein
MSTRTDTQDPPEPDSQSAPAANKPERCNTRIIDPALLADIVPPGPPERRRAPSDPPARARPATREVAAAQPPPSPIQPTAKTMVVAYAPTPARSPRRTRPALLVVAAAIALGAAGWLLLRPPAAPDATTLPASAETARTTAPVAVPPPEAPSATVAPSPAPQPSGTAPSGSRSGGPASSTPGHRSPVPAAPPAIPTTSSHVPAATSTSTMVFPSD